MNNTLISIIIPVYNESENIHLMIEEIKKHDLKYPYEILFVNDGSNDLQTEIQLIIASEKYSYVKHISFARNFGHQLALKAGLDHAQGDIVISMDGDLQHPPALLPKLISKWEEGFDIVITERKNYGKVSFFKKTSSEYYYKLISYLSTIPIQNGESDFRLLDKKVVKVLRQLNEIEPFFRGLTHWVGFKSAKIEFDADERKFGKSKYTFKKMVGFAISGILSFSSKPLYLSIYIGFFSALLSIAVFLYSLISFIIGKTAPGWTSTLSIMAFFSGMQLITFGIFGLYLSKIFIQTKNRPLYILNEK